LITLSLPGYVVLSVAARCGACFSGAVLPAGSFDAWAACHVLPGAQAAYVRDPDGSEFWLPIRMDRDI
jgi:hypothetical protein